MANVLRDAFRPIWPVEEESLAWPLSQSTTVNDLDRFAQMVRSAVTSHQPLQPAPAHHVFPFDESERASKDDVDLVPEDEQE
jgi:hypothetical protein